VARVLQEVFTPDLSIDQLRDVAAQAQFHSYATGETVYREGEEGERLHVVRRGSLTLLRETEEGPRVVGYVHSGQYVGELSIMNVGSYTETARAEVATETVSLGRDQLLALIGRDRALVQRIQANLRERLSECIEMEAEPARGRIVRFLMDHGLGEATDALIINESLCVGCDNCEAACAGTHGGVTRLNREAGPSFAGIHIPTACRHCEQPHCMKDCPPNAIHRTEVGEVFIDQETCIGCGNCYSNCPYGVIRMVSPPGGAGGVVRRLFSAGRAAAAKGGAGGQAAKKAVKCDLCKDLDGGPACVRACPTGAALRVNPDAYRDLSGRYTWSQ
jgi:Fe-S-cluster-containing hydrogenase component 2